MCKRTRHTDTLQVTFHSDLLLLALAPVLPLELSAFLALPTVASRTCSVQSCVLREELCADPRLN